MLDLEGKKILTAARRSARVREHLIPKQAQEKFPGLATTFVPLRIPKTTCARARLLLLPANSMEFSCPRQSDLV